MDVLNTCTIDLPATRTYSRREAQWFGRDENGFAGVIIRLWHGRRAGSKLVERDFYEVVETEAAPGVPGRQFVFLNRTDPEQQFPYKVRVGPHHRCTCKAGLCRVPEDDGTDGCKHVDAVQAALESEVWGDESAELVGATDGGSFTSPGTS